MAAHGGKAKAAKNRAKKLSRAERKAKTGAEIEKKEEVASGGREGNSMDHDQGVTKEQLQAAGEDIDNAPLFTDSDDDGDSSKISDGAYYPSSPPIFTRHASHYPQSKKESPNASQDDTVKHGENTKNEKNGLGSTDKLSNHAGSTGSSYPAVAMQFATEVFDDPKRDMGPPPRVPSKPKRLLEQSIDKAHDSAHDNQIQMEFLNKLVSDKRPLPKLPATGVNENIIPGQEGANGNLLGKMFNGDLKILSYADLMKEAGDKDINAFAEAKIREIEEPEYDPAKLNLQDLDDFVRDRAISVPDADKMDYIMGTDEVNESSEQVDHDNKRTPPSSDGNQSQPSSPHNVIVECLSKRTAEAIGEQLIDAAQDQAITREIAKVTIVSATHGQTNAVEDASGNNASQLDIDRDIRLARTHGSVELIKDLYRQVRGEASGSLEPLNDGDRGIFSTPPEPEGNGTSAHTNTANDMGQAKQIVDDRGIGEWVRNAMKHDIAEAAKRARRDAAAAAGDTLVAINDLAIVDLDQAEVPKPKPKKKSGNKKKKSGAKKAAAEKASASVSGFDDSYTTTGDYSQLSLNDRSEAENQDVVKAVADAVGNVGAASQKAKQPQTLGQMREEMEDAPGAQEFIKKCDVTKDHLQSIMKENDFKQVDMSKVMAHQIAEPAGKMTKDQLVSLSKNMGKKDHGKFVEENKLVAAETVMEIKGQVRQLLGEMDHDSMRNLRQPGKEKPDKGSSELMESLTSDGPAADVLREETGITSEMTEAEALHQIFALIQNHKEAQHAVAGLRQSLARMQKHIDHTDAEVGTWKGIVDQMYDKETYGIDTLRTLVENVKEATFEANNAKRRLGVLEDRLLLLGQEGAPAGEGAEAGSSRVSVVGFMDGQYRAFREEFRDVRTYIDELRNLTDGAFKELRGQLRKLGRDNRAVEGLLGEATDGLHELNVGLQRAQGDGLTVNKRLGQVDTRLGQVDTRLRVVAGKVEVLENAMSGGEGAAGKGIPDLSAEVHHLAALIGTLNRGLEAFGTKLNEDVENLVRKQEKTMTAIAVMRNDIAGLQKSGKATRITVEEHTQELASLKEKTTEGLMAVEEKMATTLGTVNATKMQVNRVIAEQNTIRNSVDELAHAKAAKEQAVDASIAGLKDYVEKGVKKMNRRADETAKRVADLSDKIDADAQKNSAQAQKLERDLNASVARVEKKIDIKSSQLTTLWCAFEREIGAVETDASDEGSGDAKARMERMSEQLATLVKEHDARVEAVAKTKAHKKKQLEKAMGAEEKAAPKLTFGGLKSEVDRANDKIAKLAVQIEELKREVVGKSAPPLAHASSQTDSPLLSKQARGTPNADVVQGLRPRVRIPHLDRLVEELGPATPAMPSPAPMLPHPSPPGSASFYAPPPPPPMMGPFEQPAVVQSVGGFGFEAFGNQQMVAQPFAAAPVMDMSMMAPGGGGVGFSAPFTDYTMGMGGPPAARPRMNTAPGPLPTHDLVLLPPQWLSGNEAFDYQNIVNTKLKEAVEEVDRREQELRGRMEFFGDALRRVSVDVRYEAEVKMVEMERRWGERVERLEGMLEKREREKVVLEERQKKMEEVLQGMMEKAGMQVPEGFGM